MELSKKKVVYSFKTQIIGRVTVETHKFLLMDYLPESIDLGVSAGTYHPYIKTRDEFNELQKKNTIEIINSELLPVTWVTTTNTSYYYKDIELEDGFMFDLPDTIEVEKGWMIATSTEENPSYVECDAEHAKSNPGFNSKQFVRLVKIEEKTNHHMTERDVALDIIVAGSMMEDAAQELGHHRPLNWWIHKKKEYIEKYKFTEKEITDRYARDWHKMLELKENLSLGDEYEHE